jgi:hypothetical protein
MAKCREQQPKPQARPSAREWWEQQQATVKRLAESPFFRGLQEDNRRLGGSPLGRTMIEEARRLREWQERMWPPPAPTAKPEPAEPTPQPEPEPLRPEPPPEPKKTAGRKQVLTPDEIERLQAAYPAAYRDNPKRKQSDVFNDLRKLLGREVSDTTLRDRIVRPLARK